MQEDLLTMIDVGKYAMLLLFVVIVGKQSKKQEKKQTSIDVTCMRKHHIVVQSCVQIQLNFADHNVSVYMISVRICCFKSYTSYCMSEAHVLEGCSIH